MKLYVVKNIKTNKYATRTGWSKHISKARTLDYDWMRASKNGLTDNEKIVEVKISEA